MFISGTGNLIRNYIYLSIFCFCFFLSPIFSSYVMADNLENNKSLNFTLKNIQKYKYIQFQVREIERKSAIIQTDNELKLLYPVPTQLRTSAQLISFEAAVELLNKTEKIDRPVDTTLQMFWETKIKCYCVNKSGISDHTLEAGGSTLAQKNHSRIKLLKNIKRSVYRIKIFYLSKFQNQ